MTEIVDIESPSAKRQFILYWGDMGGQWGVNRSVAQIHALLFLSERPMNAEQISEELGIAAMICLSMITGIWFSFARGLETLVTLEVPVEFMNRTELRQRYGAAGVVGFERTKPGAMLFAVLADGSADEFVHECRREPVDPPGHAGFEGAHDNRLIPCNAPQHGPDRVVQFHDRQG